MLLASILLSVLLSTIRLHLACGPKRQLPLPLPVRLYHTRLPIHRAKVQLRRGCTHLVRLHMQLRGEELILPAAEGPNLERRPVFDVAPTRSRFVRSVVWGGLRNSLLA